MKDRERLWPNCRHCVFYLFRASLFTYIGYLCSGFSPLAVSFCSCLPFDLDDMLLAEGLLCIRLFWNRLAFCGLISFLLQSVGASFSLFLFSLFVYSLFVFFICLCGFSSEFELLSITPFHTLMFLFPPAFHYVTPPCFCNASWEPGNGVRCRGWGKLHPPHHVLSSALDL